MVRLCFGTFIDVLLQCKRDKINRTELTRTIINTIDPDNQYIDKSQSMYRALNHLYKCTGDFTKTYSNIIELAPKVNKENVVQQFESDVLQLIDKNKREQVILALCDIIKKDATLNYEIGGENVEKFQFYVGKDIKDFLNASEYILSKFLAEIFLYTVIEIKNTVGEEWLKKISEENENYKIFFESYVNGFKYLKNTIQVCDIVADKNAKPEALKEDLPYTQPEPMLHVCHQCFEDFPIKAFIDSNPAYPIKPYLFEYAAIVVGRIQKKHEEGDSPDRNSDIYQSIVKFADTSLEYIKFLKNSSDNPNILVEGYKSLNGNDNKFSEKANCYCQQLKSLYQIINAEIEKEEYEHHVQQQAAAKETWDKNTQVGVL